MSIKVGYRVGPETKLFYIYIYFILITFMQSDIKYEISRQASSLNDNFHS